MAITLTDAATNAVLDALAAQVDAGATNNFGAMKIYDAGDVLLVTINFTDISGGGSSYTAAAARSIALNGTPLTGTAVATGVAAYFEVVDRDETEVFSGTVGIAGSGADAIIDDTDITTLDVVQLNSHTVSQ